MCGSVFHPHSRVHVCCKDRVACEQTDTPANRQINRQAGKQTRTNRQIGRQADRRGKAGLERFSTSTEGAAMQGRRPRFFLPTYLSV